ncbi:MAG: ATP-binding cassette domain-containing protein, partial [Oscillospiraceae bacterium]|nr:ATP-binding cassette domain-containing protein [Oscillospiraceae bacterium]
MLELKNISAGYGKTDVITDVSLKLDDGSLNVIIGPNGCGKSTLLKSVI